MNNRDIKFRVWDKSENTMLDWDGILRHIRRTGEATALYFEDDQEMLMMQFTGLHDKGGKEVYEGDVLKCVHFTEGKKTHYLTHYVVWNSEWHLWQTVAPNNVDAKLGTNGNPMLATYARQGDFEVIGNIYSNPELIS